MLDDDTLQQDIYECLYSNLMDGLQRGLSSTFPVKSQVGDDTALNFAKNTCDACVEAIAIGISGAISRYIRDIDIYGKIQTSGSPTTQIATIDSPDQLTNGMLPNTLNVK